MTSELDQFHALYGFSAIIAVGILYSYRSSPFIKGKQYLLYGLGCLFIMGLGIRELYLKTVTSPPFDQDGTQAPWTLTVRPICRWLDVGWEMPSQYSSMSWCSTRRRAQPLLWGEVGTLFAPWMAWPRSK